MKKKIFRRATVTVSKWCGHEDCKMAGHNEWTLRLNNIVVGVVRDQKAADAMHALAEAYNASRLAQEGGGEA